MKKKLLKIALFGPLPPGWGGARVSFKLFYDYLKKIKNVNIKHFDLPIMFHRYRIPPGKVNHILTLLTILSSIYNISKADSVIVFGSRNYCYLHGIIILIISILFKKPCYIRFFGGRPALPDKVTNGLIRQFVFKQLKMAEKIIVQTRVGASEFPVFLQPKIEVIVGYRPAPVNIKTEELKKNNKKTIKYVYAGGISIKKGVLCLINAFNLLLEKNKEIELHLYGTGELDFIKKIESYNNIFFHGRVENRVLRSELKNYDVFIYPSLYLSEGHSGSIIESMMAGMPIIASDLPGIREVLEHKKSGLLFEIGNVKELKESMSELLYNSSQRKHLAIEAKKMSKNFEAEVVLPKLVNAVGINNE